MEVRQRLKPEAVYHFALEGRPVKSEGHGEGHINSTYLVTTDRGVRYILQRIKGDLFDAAPLMENVEKVIRLARRNAEKTGMGETMNLIHAEDGRPYYQDQTGCYRVYQFVEGTICLQTPETEEDFYQSAVAFGQFQRLLEDFPAEELHEILPDFHNTENRYRIFKEVIRRDPCGRADDAQAEIAYLLDREEAAEQLCRMRKKGALPLRVTHNDTKLNNVLLDAKTRKARCVIDLDTVMPGLAAYDFGDAIRFGAATAAEDERDLNRMKLDLRRVRIFTRGYLEYGPAFTEREIESFPIGAFVITTEQAVRFLTDYLDGDHYYQTTRPDQNLDRARTQIKLAMEMEGQMDQMKAIVREERDRVLARRAQRKEKGPNPEEKRPNPA